VKRRLEQCRELLTVQDEQGQAIIIIAFAIVALILFAGLALDAATIYAGQSRLKRAVDAAALAGVVELPNEAAAADRTTQFLLANGYDATDSEVMPSFEAARLPSAEYMQWGVTATYRLRLNFLPVINFDYVEMTEVAVAEYRSMVDIYSSQTGGRGIVREVHLANWGRYANPLFGDLYTPHCWTCSGAACPADAPEDPNLCPGYGPNPDHSELYNEFSQGYSFRISVPGSYPYDELSIEILDPDSYNQPINDSVVTITRIDGEPIDIIVDCDPTTGDIDNDRQDACLLETPDERNPYWFLRLDENRAFNGKPESYNEAYATTTHYRLYYHKQLADQSMIKSFVDPTYVGGYDASHDMEWVEAWRVDLNSDLPGIVTSEDGDFSLYLEVDGVSGSSKNGFDLWAGPPYTGIPTNINERNIYLLHPDNHSLHDPAGVVTYGSGYLPLVTTADPTEIMTVTFTFVPEEALHIGMNLFHFDSDFSPYGQGIDYYLDGVGDWHYAGTLSLNGTWSTSQNYVYQEPGTRDHDTAIIHGSSLDPDEFYGGYLLGKFYPRFLKTSTWHLEYQGIVGEVFVRLIE
jgi:hypothetical protein